MDAVASPPVAAGLKDDPARLAGMALEALSREAGADRRLVSFYLDFGVSEAATGQELVLTVRCDRKTSTLSFISLEARRGVDLVVTARGIFSRVSA